MGDPPPAPPRPPDPGTPEGGSLYERAFALFSRLRALDGTQRERALAEGCGGDADLRAEVASLLAHDLPEGTAEHDPAARAVAAAAAQALDARARGAALPERIGRYRVVRRIAEGGMGVVYEARQEQPSRTVALKVVRPDMATRASLRRLEHEAEALAQLSHPGIAQVYEAGTHDAGLGPQPFVAMELVRGVRLDEWFQVQAPTPRERIRLVAEVAEAVHHAHQRGVVHRDLKPGNVLVQEDGRPKVLDFGIARMAGGPGGTGTLATQAGQVLGTLPYMSPEQISGRPGDVDTRTDVYALGVILYEALAGRLPLDVTGDSLASASRRVLEEQPPALGRLDARWRGDVETIVAKALAKDREERYGSAQAFADDLRRHLADQPIEARRPSAMYVLRKLARRHRALALVLLLLVATLLASAVGGAWLAAREGAARELADARAGEAARERDEARRLAYRGALVGTAAALSEPDVLRAEVALHEAPEGLRGWEWRYLRARLEDAAQVLRAAPGRTYGMVRARSDALALVDYAAGSIEGRVLSRPLGAEAGPEGVPLDFLAVYPSLSPGGEHVVFGVEAGRLEVADARTGERGAPLTLLDGGGGYGFVARDGRHAWSVASLMQGPGVRVSAWPDEAREPVAEWRVSEHGSIAHAAAADASTLLLGGGRGVVHVLRRGPDGRALPALAHALHAAPIAGLALDASGGRAASCATDSTLLVWDLEDARVRMRAQGRPEELRGVTFAPDGRRLLTWGSDGGIRLREQATGAVLATLLGHRGAVSEAFFTADGRHIVSLGGDDRSVRLWDPEASDASDFACVGHRSYVYEARFSPDGRRLATIAWDGTLRIWDAATGAPLASVATQEGAPGYSLAWSPEGERLLVVAERRGVAADARVRHLASGEERVLAPSCPPGRVVAWSKPAGAIALGTHGALLLLDPTSYAEQARLEIPEAQALAFSHDGTRLAVARDTHAIEVWDLPARRRLHTFLGHADRVRCVAFHPDGETLASASWDATIRVWDLRTGKERATLSWHRRRAHAVAFSPDGSRMFTGADDGRLAVWEARRLELLLALPAHGWYVHGIDVAPDGETVVTCSGDARVRLWSTSGRGTLRAARAR